MSVLGPVLVLTDRRQALQPLVDVVRACVAGGARSVVLREKDLAHDERRRLFDELRPIVPTLLVAGTSMAGFDGADGLHHPRPDLTSTRDPSRGGRGPSPVAVSGVETGCVGVSCHDAAEIEAAATADYVTVSPVFATESKPGYGPALGVDGLHQLVCGTTVPVYALGGIDADTASRCRAAGAAGVAVMGALMRADDPESLARHLGRAFEAAV